MNIINASGEDDPCDRQENPVQRPKRIYFPPVILFVEELEVVAGVCSKGIGDGGDCEQVANS